MDPQTGGILGMMTLPTFVPEARSFFPQEWYKNPIVSDSYEPGSTFKTVVMAAGIDAGVINHATVCNVCSGPRKVGDALIKTWNNQYQDNPTMTDVLVHSDNTGMVFVGDKLGHQKLHDYVTQFGFGGMSGIDLQEEASPELRKASEMREIDYATLTFGQGVAVTPIQMVRAVGVLANKGVLMQPEVVQSIVREGKTITIDPKTSRKVISERAAAEITDMMVQSSDHGEAKHFQTTGYRIAGKTGTAQVPINGVYDDKRTIASFVGFAPADDPKFVMLVKLTDPQSSQWGSETAAPLFFSITKDILQYYHIAPTQ